MEFEPVERQATVGTPLQVVLFCPTHQILFAHTSFPLDPSGLLALRSGEAVALDHMIMLGCRVFWIEPHIML